MMTRHKLVAFCSSRTNFISIWRIVGFLIGLALVCLPQARAGGAVTSCDENSLRTALSGGGLVTFDCSGTITVTLANGGSIQISYDTTIDGNGQNVIISGGGNLGVFFVPAGVKLNLNKLTIANAAGGFGAIENEGTLTVTNSTFSGNNGFDAGGIGNGGGTVTVRNSTFSGNSSQRDGGGIANEAGTLTVRNCKFTSNTGTYGGGITNITLYNSPATLTVNNSTFSGNSAQIDGGGIENDAGTLTVTNSTFSGNTGYSEAGGIENDGGTATVTNSTFFGNTGIYVGGGIENYLGTLTVINSTLSGNISGEGGGLAASSPSTSRLVNTIVVNSCSNPYGGLMDGGGNLNWPAGRGCPGINVDPMLDPSGLQNNGGPTKTLALLAGSPAAPASAPQTSNCPIRDQRGFPRPFASPCSIGAYEPGTLFKSFRVNDGASSFTANSFAVSGTFTLGADSDPNINPPMDVVRLRFGTFTIIIPAGSFAPTAAGSFVYGGVPPPGGVTFQMTIQPLGGSLYAFRASATGQNIMAGTTSPVTVQLTVDDDGGTTRTPVDPNDD